MLMLLEDKKIVILLITALILGLFIYLDGPSMIAKEEKKEEKQEITEEEEEIIIPTLQIIDQESDSRVFAVMINNHPLAMANHAGLQDAFIVYEIIVEGAYSRLMAFYRDQETEKIGSVRSARHYYLDYALEYDALYVHFGGSPTAYEDIRSLKVNNLDFLVRMGYFRDNSLSIPWEHRAYTSVEMINEQLTKMKSRTTSDNTYLNYSIEAIRLSGEDVLIADFVKMKYSSANRIQYQYRDGFYYRSVNEKEHSDAVTKEQYYFKNILIMNVRNYLLGSKGRQELDTVGTGKGYFVTNGLARPITWEKTSRSAKTSYRFDDGEEVIFNDGNTIFQVMPINAEIQIEAKIVEEEIIEE